MSAAFAQADPKVEIGASLAGATLGLEENDATTFGVPSSELGIVNPGVYVSIFAGSQFAIEPQIGLIWVSSGGESDHLLNFAAQADYFMRGSAQSSPYVFGAIGVIDVSGSDTTPKSVSGGAGYRTALGDRLALRVDGRFTHLSDDGGNSLSFTLSIGGLFGQR